MEVKGDIVYSKTIVKNVAEKMGIDEKKVQHVFNFLFPFIRKLSRQPEVFSISLFGIGRVYMSTNRWKNVLLNREKYDRVSSRQRANHNRLKTKIVRCERIFKEAGEGRTLYTVHKKRSSIANWFYTDKKTLLELETIQNEESHEYDKKG